MPENSIVLIGGGGHCVSIIDVIEREGRFSIAGIIDRQNVGKKVLGYTIIASDAELPQLAKEYKNFLITVGHIDSNEARTRLFHELKKLGATLPSIVSPLAYVSKHASIGEGAVVMHNAFVNANARIGKNVIVNTAAIVEHDATVGNHCHISTAGVVNGGCSIGDHTFIGSNAMIKQYLTVGERVIVGASSVVLNNLESNGLYAGNPAVLKRKIV